MQKDGIPKLLTARRNHNLNTCDIKYRTIDSTKNHFKVYLSQYGTVTFPAASAGNTAQRKYVDINHNLGYQPSIVVNASGPDGKNKAFPIVNNGTTGPTKWCAGYARLNNNTIRLYFYIYDPFLDSYSQFDINYRYYIYIDPNKNVWS